MIKDYVVIIRDDWLIYKYGVVGHPVIISDDDGDVLCWRHDQLDDAFPLEFSKVPNLILLVRGQRLLELLAIPQIAYLLRLDSDVRLQGLENSMSSDIADVQESSCRSRIHLRPLLEEVGQHLPAMLDDGGDRPPM